ncbi:RIP metalloprotease RseP [Marivirga atlantica]|jgi:regulator of sigma E protease|uniref:Zinc metalloprotease n=1 Tax=Marivirga atlantica TaxID=1548457 RepID=A0A937AHZ0_9BACT|nr:RIP metalloprotease RseP [Marivirga atlantica]MBL0766769.1 RIP metalloprotease RseP [Marivirga atlantica]
METIIMIAQLILGLSILVGVHEFGHLLAAKAFGMRVEQFSIGFPPKIFSFKYGETEYSLSAIPLGGFVKISGMIDESLDTKNLSKEPEPYEFRAKPAWQRLIVMLGGIIVNVIVGIIIFVFITFGYGESYIPKDVVVNNGVYAYDLGQEIGLQTGDKIIALNGQDYRKFDDLTNADVLLTDNSYYTVLRNGEEVKVTIPNDMLDRITEDNDRVDFIEPLFPFKVGAVQPQSNADMAGLKEGEKIVAINGQPVKYFQEFKEELGQHKNQRVALAIKQGEGIARTDSVLVSDDGTIGFAVDMDVDLAHQDFSFGESISIGTKKAFGVVWTNIRAFGKIFKGEVSASKSLSGPIGIAQIFGGEWIWSKFWAICGLLSMVLAFMNLLPIPALDGGHVVFLSYEIISGRKPSDKFLEGAQKVGMVLLLGLMAFAIFNDIWKAIF